MNWLNDVFKKVNDKNRLINDKKRLKQLEKTYFINLIKDILFYSKPIFSSGTNISISLFSILCFLALNPSDLTNSSISNYAKDEFSG